jgi:hypothetical protein
MFMPISNSVLKDDVKVYFSKYIESGVRILDVGIGVGTYGKLLKNMGYKMDGIEIWLPYITKYDLNALYDNIIIGNVMTYDTRNYDVIILGDILEHLSVDDGLRLMDRVEKCGQVCIVAVPYQSDQGAWEGNVYETHHQNDLTNEVVLKRYNNLNLLFKNDYYRYGYYINRRGYYNNDIQCYVGDINLVSNRLQIEYLDRMRVDYINDGGCDIDVTLRVYDGDVEIYSYNTNMKPASRYYACLFNDSNNPRKFVFTGDGIHKVYEV